MAYSTHFEHTEDSIHMLDEKFGNVVDDRFIYCLKEGKWKLDDIIRFKSRLELAYSYTNMEYDRLLELRKTFNKEYATNNNKYFSTAAQLMSKMRSTLSAYKKIIYEFREGKGKRNGRSQQTLSAYDHSPLVGGAYSPDCFGWEPYDDAVKNLYKLLVSYLDDAKKCLDICNEVIEEEAFIRSNREQYLPLYDNCFNRSFHNNRVTIQALNKAKICYDNEYVTAMEDAADVEALISELFHMLDVAQWNDFVISKGVHDALKVGLTPLEGFLWGKDSEAKVLRVRLLLSHISELGEKIKLTNHHGKLSGFFLMRLFSWCEILNPSQHGKLLEYVQGAIAGVFDTVNIGAVNAEKRKDFLLDNDIRYEKQIQFNAQIDAFIDQLQEKQQTSDN